MNIGVMGGTFDPVHLGHLAIAEQALTQLDMTEVIFVPAGDPYFKKGTDITSPLHRVSMLNLALADKAGFSVSLIEIERSGPSYAVDTIRILKERFRKDDEIFFVLGWDSLLTLPLWYQPERLMGLCRFVAALRTGFLQSGIQDLQKKLPGIAERIVVLANPLIDISSTQIRDSIGNGLSIDDLVPPKVADYIKIHGLYRANQQD
jgi:nicotinate-nucleotide adenylyltransferase